MNILDKDFKYVPSNKTDIRKTFARIKREMEQAKPKANVMPIKRTIVQKAVKK